MSVASKRGSHNDRFYEEFEYDRKMKKRRARLITAAEEAFTHIKRMRENQFGKKLQASAVNQLCFGGSISEKFNLKQTFEVCPINRAYI